MENVKKFNGASMERKEQRSLTDADLIAIEQIVRKQVDALYERIKKHMARTSNSSWEEDKEHACLNDFIHNKAKVAFKEDIQRLSTGESRLLEVDNPDHIKSIWGRQQRFKAVFMPLLIRSVYPKYLAIRAGKKGTWSKDREAFFHFLCVTLHINSAEEEHFRHYFNKVVREHGKQGKAVGLQRKDCP